MMQTVFWCKAAKVRTFAPVIIREINVISPTCQMAAPAQPLGAIEFAYL